ncbi:DEAD/DEAH box helicase family protein (plasmid) [Deinococcus radiomollis]|uniref:DEAD/DEAH box helicase family protein n=1 Tax=Deinococcus radiomollis TaxID=468916 RepID=UPI00389228E3
MWHPLAGWREEDAAVTAALSGPVGTPLWAAARARILGWREEPQLTQLDRDWHEGPRTPSPKDALIASILRPERLLELIRGYVVFDAGVKKVARYQQYFAVKEMVRRVRERTPEGARCGGVIWHITGSGKSLTMVMLAHALTRLPDAPAPRVVLVTDRIDLDDQIRDTFKNTGAAVVQAKTGQHLLELLASERAMVITAVIDKFETVAREKLKVQSPDIFVLVDESHRSQYGSANALMRSVLPNACYLSFTGTPLTRKEKSTAQKFGGIVHAYSMARAVQDGAVAPLKYEARHAELRGAQEQLDRWFERVTRDLRTLQKADLISAVLDSIRSQAYAPACPPWREEVRSREPIA